MSRLPVFLLLPLVACGVVFDEVGCDLRENGANGPEPRCQERTGTQGNVLFGSFCDVLGGEGVDGLCPDRDQIVFGCEISGEVVDWYYPPKTADEADATCGGDTVVAAP